MNPWFAKAAVLLASAVMVAIRAPHGQRSRAVKVVTNRKDGREVTLLLLAWLGFLMPILWVATPVFSVAEFALRPTPFVAGTLCLACGLWIFFRSHADLSTNWSITLEIREGHRLVTDGIYRHIRHPMYSGFLLYSLGQALVVPNWLAGPSYLLAFGVLFILRVGREE